MGRFNRIGTKYGIGLMVLGGCMGLWLVGSANADDKPVDFASQIQPIFKDSCVKCHSLNTPRKQAAGGLQLDDKDAALKGGKHGHDIVPGDSTQSLLYKLLLGPTTVDGKHVDAMPKQKRGEEFKALDKTKIDLIKSWIDQGAKWSS
jgi:hypothetical protein